MLELALREVLAFGDSHVGTAHVLLGLTRANDDVADRLLSNLGADPDRVAEEVLRLRSAADGSWREGAWEEPAGDRSRSASSRRHRPLRATAVRAAAEVALNAANTSAREAQRPIDLGYLLLALAEGWPEDLVALAFAELGIDVDRVREAVQAAREGTQ